MNPTELSAPSPFKCIDTTASGTACRGVDMELQNNDLGTLFQQLNLDSDPASIDAFIASHPLPNDVKLVDAEFWSPAQAAFLKEQLREDADWAMTVDELNVRLHESH
jgi:hypothetical protein